MVSFQQLSMTMSFEKDLERALGDGERASSSQGRHSREDELEFEKRDSTGLQTSPLEPLNSHGTTTPRNNAIQQILSARSTASYNPSPPPDGGLTAWTQAVMAHFVIFTTWGYINSYGVFQTYYTSTLGHPPSDISWVGSMQIFLIFFIGTASGRALDAGLFKPVLLTGIALQLIGIFTTSVCQKYWQLFLAQGVCMGIGSGLQFCPTMALLSTYFTRHRNLAIGIAASGSAAGGMVFPAIVKELLPRIGFGWTVRTIGFLNLTIGLVTGTFLKTRLPPRKSGPLVEWHAFREMPYLFYVLGMFLNFWGLYFGFYYVVSYARDKTGLPYSDSILLLLAMNGVGLVFRILPNYLADRFAGPLNTLIPCAFASGVMMFGWAGVKSISGAWVFAVIFGIGAAGIQGLFPAGLSSLTQDQRKAGTRMGMGFSVVGIACLTGPPLAGALIQLHPTGSYIYAQVWAGSSIMLGTLIICGSRIAKTGWVFWQRC